MIKYIYNELSQALIQGPQLLVIVKLQNLITQPNIKHEMLIFGKNNNHLIKNNYKHTFSLPQKVKIIKGEIVKCACGYDFIICITKESKVYCYFQSAIYELKVGTNEKIVTVATQNNLILLVSSKGQLFACQFLPQMLLNDALKPKKVKLNLGFDLKSKMVKQVYAMHQHIFLKLQNNSFIFLKQNSWLQTNTFSEPQVIEASQIYNFIDIAQNLNQTFFLTNEGSLLKSTKGDLLNLSKVQLKEKLAKIGSNNKQLFGINADGAIVQIFFNQNKGKTLRVTKMATKFIDLIVSSQNFYAITEDREVWVWGKNSNGELGLSDYQPRLAPYPMISLERYYVNKIFIGDNYACCLIDETRIRQSIKSTQRSDHFQLDQQHRYSLAEQIEKKLFKNAKSDKSSLSQIHYTQSSSEEVFEKKAISSIKQNKIINKKPANQKKGRSARKNIMEKELKVSHKNFSKKQTSDFTRKYCSCAKHEKQSVHSKTKLTPKGKDRMECENQLRTKNKSNVGVLSERNKSEHKILKKQQNTPRYKTPNKAEIENKKRDGDIQRTKYEKRIQQLEDKNQKIEFELKNRTSENKDLFQLVKNKNLVIQDITGKIILLEDAIAQHQKSLTARDNQAEDAFLREKQYQLHIRNLQSQVQKMIDLLNSNEQNKQSQIYRKQLQRLSLQVKQKIQGEKQYYRERMKGMERKFEEEKNLYELEIKNLQAELYNYKRKEADLIVKLSQHNETQKAKQPPIKIEDQNGSLYMQSPTFHTVQVINRKKYVGENEVDEWNNESKVTLNKFNEIQEKKVLQQKIQQNMYLSPYNKDHQKVKKYATCNNQKDEYQINDVRSCKGDVENILNDIQKNKSSISKSAIKLFNLLQNDNVC